MVDILGDINVSMKDGETIEVRNIPQTSMHRVKIKRTGTEILDPCEVESTVEKQLTSGFYKKVVLYGNDGSTWEYEIDG